LRTLAVWGRRIRSLFSDAAPRRLDVVRRLRAGEGEASGSRHPRPQTDRFAIGKSTTRPFVPSKLERVARGSPRAARSRARRKPAERLRLETVGLGQRQV
jgi:hypothetical protein